MLMAAEMKTQSALEASTHCEVAQGWSRAGVRKVFPREALLFPINIAEDRTKGSGALFCVSSLGPAVGGLVFIAF